jgi:hypothetical protein
MGVWGIIPPFAKDDLDALRLVQSQQLSLLQQCEDLMFLKVRARIDAIPVNIAVITTGSSIIILLTNIFFRIESALSK